MRVCTFHAVPFLADGWPVVTKDVQYSLIASKRAKSSAFAFDVGPKNASRSAPWNDPMWGLSYLDDRIISL